MVNSAMITTPAKTIRQAVRDVCPGCLDAQECYRKVKNSIGLSSTFRARDPGIVASEWRKMTTSSGFAEALERCSFQTDAEAAAAMGCSQSKINEWRRGVRPVPQYIMILVRCLENKEGKK